MTSKLYMVLFFGIFSLYVQAQSQVENMIRDAKEYNAAYLDNDFELFTKMIIPSVVKLAGGKDRMAKISKEHYHTMTASGMKYISITPKKPSKIMLGGEDLHAIIPQQVITKIGEDKFERIAYYLASSDDEGKTWTFVDLDPYDAESIKIFVPSFTGDLEIPSVEYAQKINN